jgi:hypothetical protein
MKLITHFTDSHAELYEDFLLPSIKKDYNFEILSNRGQQYSLNGGYNTEGFNQTTRDKIKFLLDSLNSIEPFETALFCDVDIVFLQNPIQYFEKYEQYDMVFQNGYTEFNTGFFLLKNKVKVKELLKEVVENCHLYTKDNDQEAINTLIKKTTLKYTHFDSLIACPATYNGLKIWGGEEVILTNSPIAFHACWCSGVENKKSLLNKILNENS